MGLLGAILGVTTRVAIHSAVTGLVSEINAKVASTPSAWTRGFSGRRFVGDDEAILFVFPKLVTVPFTMRATFVPLDMLFLDADRRIVWIVSSAEPLSMSDYVSPRPFLYAIEMRGGWLRDRKIEYNATIGWG